MSDVACKNYLYTDELMFKPICVEHCDRILSWGSDPDNVKYMGWGPSTREQVLNFVKNTKPGYDFGVFAKQDNILIGTCGIYPDRQNDTAELGYILHKDYHGNGYGTQVVRELVRYGFEDLCLRRIFAPCATLNIASSQVLQKNNMRLEAVNIQAHFAVIDKVWIDQSIYAILNWEYNNNIKQGK